MWTGSPANRLGVDGRQRVLAIDEGRYGRQGVMAPDEGWMVDREGVDGGQGVLQID